MPGSFCFATPFPETNRVAELPFPKKPEVGPLQVRVPLDEEDASRMQPHAVAEGYVRGRIRQQVPLRFIRIEPRVVPKLSLTGSTIERVDTRVLFVVYEAVGEIEGVYAGQKLDVFIQSPPSKRNPAR